VVDSDCVAIETIAEGSSSANEVQVLRHRKVPSRVIVSQVNELVASDAWGTNWEDVYETPLLRCLDVDGTFGPYSVGQDRGVDNEFYVIRRMSGGPQLANLCKEQRTAGQSDCPSNRLTDTDYSQRSYCWGRGLSHTVSKQFLLNLVNKRLEF
jgi:hypothetical protein